MNKIKRALIQTHRYLGLFLGLNFLILCLSGALLIWKDELENKNQAKLTKVTDSKAYQNVESYLLVHYPAKKILSIFRDDYSYMQARLGELNTTKFRGATKLIFSADGKELLEKKAQTNNFVDLVYILHRELFLGAYGKYLVGLLGLFILCLVATGIYSATKFYKSVKNINTRINLGLFHKKLGLLSFGWLTLVTFTGICLAFNSILLSLFLKGALGEQQASYQDNKIIKEKIVGTNEVTKVIAKDFSDYKLDYLSFPNNEFSLKNHFSALMSQAGSSKIVFLEGTNPNSYEMLELPWYLELLIVSEPLHFGDYGGIALKVFWTIMAIACGSFPLSGIFIYLLRKKKINPDKLHKYIPRTLSISDFQLYAHSFLILIVVMAVFIWQLKWGLVI